MYKKTLIAILIGTTILTSGCGAFERESTAEKTDTNAQIVNDMSDLDDGGYYILRGDQYEQLYAQDSNYELDSSTKPTSANEDHTLWYKDDWSKVPTMYKGDILVYKTTQSLDETFYLERFEYVGYTVGITSLEQTESGRYSFQTDPDKMNINVNSDAEQLTNLKTNTAIIDKIGGGYLREGNVSSGGCILGLSRDKTYLAEIYAGTIMHEYKLKADSVALTSMELYKSVNYDFLESEILSINFPDYFNSGYYLINNYGLVRYVNGTSYDDDTDFNVPNVEPDEEETTESSSSEEAESAEEDDSTIQETVTIKEAGDYTVTVAYSNDSDASTIPSATIYNDDNAYKLASGSGNTLSKKVKLKKGEYTLEISNLAGRTCEYSVEKEETFTEIEVES